MSGATWREYLKDVFKGYDSPDQIDLHTLADDLRARGTSGLEEIDSRLTKLEEEGKKDILVTLLWDLAHLEDKKPEEQRKVYATLASHYDKLFNWDDVSSPGWFIIPGPFFP